MTREELIEKWGISKVEALLHHTSFIHGTEQEDTDNIDQLLTDLEGE